VNGVARRQLTPALLAPVFLGLAPVLGRAAFLNGSDSLTVAAFRTVVAVVLLWVSYLLFARRYIFIFPAGLLSCIVVGTVNGIGSLMYYGGLNALNNASVAQLLNASYLIFSVVLARFNGQPISRRTWFRISLMIIAILLLTGGYLGTSNWLGVGLMLGNAILFAGTLMLSQRVLYEMPSPTVTLYVLSAMAGVVLLARLVVPMSGVALPSSAWLAIAALGLTTALSRLTLFAGVKQMGTLQTVLVGILETAVAVVLSFVLFGERFSTTQWFGVGLMVLSLLLAQPNDLRPHFGGPLPFVTIFGSLRLRRQRKAPLVFPATEPDRHL